MFRACNLPACTEHAAKRPVFAHLMAFNWSIAIRRSTREFIAYLCATTLRLCFYERCVKFTKKPRILVALPQAAHYIVIAYRSKWNAYSLFARKHSSLLCAPPIYSTVLCALFVLMKLPASSRVAFMWRQSNANAVASVVGRVCVVSQTYRLKPN